MKKRVISPVIFFCVVILDVITKQLIETYIHPPDFIEVFPFLRIVNVKNKGAAFGIFSQINNNVFIIISIIAIVAIMLYLLKTRDKLEIISLSLVLGGATGNLIDRITISQVIDFIDFFINTWHWPAFNVADSALTIGIILFLFANIRQHRTKDT
ncbi:MAG: signal peptidase II [Thermodesulfovibrionia bacterium]|nr:signal peptidase II [Thermodesulfovibrionia bacterium]MCK5286312.1 signal peptidase II [Thermodesulfovibrionia bacterium]